MKTVFILHADLVLRGGALVFRVADVYPAKKIPFMKDLQEDKWIGDSEKMVSYIEEKFPPPKYQKLGKPEEVTDMYVLQPLHCLLCVDVL